MRLSVSTFAFIGPAFGIVLPVLFSIPAAAQSIAPSSSIISGSVAEPPQGYLDFCARHSDQCGLAGSYLAAGSPPLQLAAKSLGDDSVHPASTFSSDSRRTFDWRSVFAPAPAEGGSIPQSRRAALGIATNTPVSGAFPAMTAEFWRQLETVNRTVNVTVRSVSDVTHYGVEDFWELPFQGGGNAGDCEDYVLQKRQMLLARGIPMTALSIALVRTSWNEPHAVLLVRSSQGDYVLDNLTSRIKPWTEVTYSWIKWQSGNNPEAWVRPALR